MIYQFRIPGQTEISLDIIRYAVCKVSIGGVKADMAV